MVILDWSYRIGMNIASRALRSMIRAKGVPGLFSVGANATFYEFDGIRFVYDYSKFGVAGNIDSGGSTEEATRAKLRELLNAIGVFYDIGAHEGLFTIDVKKELHMSLWSHSSRRQKLSSKISLSMELAMSGFTRQQWVSPQDWRG